MKRHLIIMSLTLTLIVLLMVPTFAWLGIKINYEFKPILGATEVSYFESGDGSKEDPYVISNKVHMYNLAWLQYIGYFNLGPNANNERAQSYFVLKNDIDMEQLAIPPIGTTQYPFLGNFDGKGYVVTNCVTANAGNLLEKRPYLASFNESNLLAECKGTTEEAGAIIGFFGVVGDYGSGLNNLQTKGATISEGTAPENANDKTLYKDDITIRNFGIYKYVLDNDSSNTIVGFIAGYVNAKVEYTKVGEAVLNASATKLSTSPTNNISDYLLIGYCTDPYKGILKVSILTSYTPSITEGEKHVIKDTDDGTAQGWGGSIAMDDLFANLNNVVNNRGNRTDITYKYYNERLISADGAIIDESFNQQTTSDYYRSDLSNISSITINKEEKTNVIVSDYFSLVFYPDDNYLYISGGYRNVDKQYIRGTTAVTAYTARDGNNYLNLTKNGTTISLVTTTSSANVTKYAYDGTRLYTDIDGQMIYLDEYTGFYIHTGNNYLSISTGNNTTITNQTQKNNASVWYFENGIRGNGYIYTLRNNTRYYLTYNDGLDITTDQNNASDWEIDSNNRMSTLERIWIYETTYYLRYNNGWTANSNYSTQLTFTENYTITQSGTMYPLSLVTEPTYLVFNDENSTYIPLQMQMDGDTCLYIPADNNTGYITSGVYSNDDDSARDLRVSRYGIESINTPSIIHVINSSGDGFVEITLSNYENDQDYIDANLKKFKDSVETYQKLLGGSYLYGLHFMKGIIDMNSLVTIPTAVINGNTYTNYKVPADCIDFSLKEKGYINFYAGTYYGRADTDNLNNYFFTLHQIKRDENQNIISIKEIKKIYERVVDGNVDIHSQCIYEFLDDNGNIYYEQYIDGSYVVINSIPSDYKMTFDMEWITTKMNGWEDKQAYYFEVPASPGEYALGSSSVDGQYGAYLIYLDISANAQEVQRTTITQVIEETVNRYDYVKGVNVSNSQDIDSDNNNLVDFNENEFFGILLPSGYNGSLNLKRDDTSINYTDTGNSIVSSTEGLIINKNDYIQEANETETITLYTKIVTYIDQNLTTKEYTEYVITRKEYLDENGEKQVKVTVIVNGEDKTSELIINSSDYSTTTVLTTKDEDIITWSNVNDTSTKLLVYSYNIIDDTEVTNNFEYKHSTFEEDTISKFNVTITSTNDIIVTTTTVISNYNININGSVATENTNITITAQTN